MNSGTFWAAVAAVAAAFGVWSQYNSSMLADELAELQRTASSFDASIVSGTLVLESDAAVFSEPERLFITPIFSDHRNTFVTGQSVEFPVNTAVLDIHNNMISFSHVIDRVCSYRVNVDQCANLSLEVLRVSISVNGVLDSDDVAISSVYF